MSPSSEARLESVPPDCGAADAFLGSARRFVSDGQTAGLSSESRYALLYDGIHNATLAVLAASGRRVTQGLGHHAKTIEEAGRLLGADSVDAIRRADSARRVRNRIQYEIREVSESQALAMVSDAETLLAMASAYVRGRC